MERRVFVAILLSFSVLYAYQTFLVPPPPPLPTASTPPQAAQQASTAQRGSVDGPPPASPSAPINAGSPELSPVTTEPGERQITVETSTVQAVLSNRGGRLLHWRLKGYRDPSGREVDLVPSSVPAGQPAPFSLRVPDAQVSAQLNSAIYRVSGDSGGRVDATGSPRSLVFEFEDSSGLRARKEFGFEPASHVLRFSVAVSRGADVLNPAVALGPGLSDAGASAGGGSYFTGNAVQPPEAIVSRNASVSRLLAAAIAETPAHEGPFDFAGVDDHYFAAVAVKPGASRIEFTVVSQPGPGDTAHVFVAPTISFAQPPNGARFFLGPKQFDLLQAADPGLVRAINFGMFDVVVVPLLNSLKWLYGFIGNYGWAIIALTILINLVMFPLRHKSAVAMRKMQAIQPLMKAIQDRYAHLKMTDPARQKMQAEVAALYKEKGVNPASGCVPMLLTLPVLLAFYSLLSQAIELRGAPFTGWIRDLSSPDPYYVLPALMGVTMFWQQKITPAAMDPAQQRIMMIMPVMFTAMMLLSPSGVVLYWFVSNLWTIGQQYFTNWLIGPPLAQARPVAQRQMKTAGTGRTAGAQRVEQP
jgi:YidC/Oxa1 family membrane protein insertase